MPVDGQTVVEVLVLTGFSKNTVSACLRSCILYGPQCKSTGKKGKRNNVKCSHILVV